MAEALLSETIAALYAQPLGEFTTARSDAVARLRKSGERDLAKAVAALRKPSTRLWALNQVGRAAAGDLESLFNAGDRVREAQQRVLAGDRDAAGDLRAAALEQRQLADVLARRAGMVLTAAGHGVTDTLTRDLASVLASAAVADLGIREALRAGALVDEPGPMGFPEPDGTARPAPPPTPPARPDRPDSRHHAAEVERNRRESEAHIARAKADRRAHEAAALEEQARRARVLADTARAEAETAEMALQQAIAALQEARG